MENTLEILKQHDFMFKKKFGQNFITDTNLLNAIVDDAGVKNTDEVLEIGTGAGTLTMAIAQRCKKVLTVEIDRSLKPILDKTFKDLHNIELCFADFMKVSSKELNSHFEGKFKVVANLPYYITTPIIFKLLSQGFNVSSITIMVQKEVADRLVSQSGTKNYGAITAQIEAIADVEIKRNVNRNMFTPMPNVDSAIVTINLRPNKFKVLDYKILSDTIECAFSMRRKTLANCLKNNMGLTQPDIDLIFDKLEFHPQIRGEVLNTQKFVLLSNEIYNLKNK